MLAVTWNRQDMTLCRQVRTPYDSIRHCAAHAGLFIGCLARFLITFNNAPIMSFANSLGFPRFLFCSKARHLRCATYPAKKSTAPSAPLSLLSRVRGGLLAWVAHSRSFSLGRRGGGTSLVQLLLTGYTRNCLLTMCVFNTRCKLHFPCACAHPCTLWIAHGNTPPLTFNVIKPHLTFWELIFWEFTFWDWTSELV